MAYVAQKYSHRDCTLLHVTPTQKFNIEVYTKELVYLVINFWRATSQTRGNFRCGAIFIKSLSKPIKICAVCKLSLYVRIELPAAREKFPFVRRRDIRVHR